jgi:hypothetical protein
LLAARPAPAPPGYSYGRGPDGNPFWQQCNPDGYCFGRAATAPTAATSPSGFSKPRIRPARQSSVDRRAKLRDDDHCAFEFDIFVRWKRKLRSDLSMIAAVGSPRAQLCPHRQLRTATH